MAQAATTPANRDKAADRGGTYVRWWSNVSTPCDSPAAVELTGRSCIACPESDWRFEMRKVVFSAIAAIAIGIAATSAPALARGAGGGGGGHFGGGGGHFGGGGGHFGGGGIGHFGGGGFGGGGIGHFGGGGIGHFGGLGMGHIGGAGTAHLGGATTGLGIAHGMTGAHAAAVNPGHVAGLHHRLGHDGFRHRGFVGGVYGDSGYYDSCYWQRLNEPWLPYCY
jgi:hypothetical protein